MPHFKPPIPPTPSHDGKVGVEHFYAYTPDHTFYHVPTGIPWSAAAVNDVLPPQIEYDAHGQPVRKNGKFKLIKPASWMMRYLRIEQIAWAPGFPTIVADKYVADSGWREQPGAHCLNLYRPPTTIPGDPNAAGPWLEHIHWLYGDADGKHIASWLAHRVQRPQVKPNHALFLGGAPGVGKDLMLAPVQHAIGSWNFREIGPEHLFQPFNPWAQSIILRLSEAHDTGEIDRLNRFALYERLKRYSTSPPETIPYNEKYRPMVWVFNVLGLIITSNHKADGIFLPNDDRRHYVAWTDRTKEELTNARREWLCSWYDQGGNAHVTAFLQNYDLSGFDAYAPPTVTTAMRDIIAANIAPEDEDLTDAIECVPEPQREAITIVDIVNVAPALEWLTERKSRRAMPFRLERCGYVPCHNPNSKDGRWQIKINGGANFKNIMIYVPAKMLPTERLAAVQRRRDRGL
jgi:hypothetical protein